MVGVVDEENVSGFKLSMSKRNKSANMYKALASHLKYQFQILII